MSELRGYMRTARQYMATPKARYDLREYGKAAALVLATCAVAMTVAGWLA